MAECGRRLRGVLVALAVPLGLALLGPGAYAQGSRGAGRGRAPARAPVKRPAAAADGGASPSAQSASNAAAASGATSSSVLDAGVVEARTLDGGTHVFKFTELDIEGRLKSPQIVYFLRRVRAEFAAGDLGHRSFLQEMSETRKEPTF